MEISTSTHQHIGTSAIVILNWNGAKLMEKFLPSVLANSPADIAEIVVADNGSTDNSVAMLKEKFPSVRIIQLDKNYGFAEGYNRAIAQIDSEYTVLLNSDVEVTPHWLDAPLAAMERDRKIAAVQPKILAYNDKKMFEYAGGAGGYIDRYGYPYCRGRIFTAIEEDKGQYDTPADLLWATGACLFVRTDVFKREGGLDAKFFAHQEEIDMCWRLRARGYRIVCVPESKVYHVGGATLEMEHPHKTFLNFRNNLLMLYKNLPDDDLKHVLRMRRILDFVAAVKFIATGGVNNAIAVRRARKEFHALQKEYKSIREENMQKAVCKNIPEVRRECLLTSFYIGRKRRFAEME